MALGRSHTASAPGPGACLPNDLATASTLPNKSRTVPRTPRESGDRRPWLPTRCHDPGRVQRALFKKASRRPVMSGQPCRWLHDEIRVYHDPRRFACDFRVGRLSAPDHLHPLRHGCPASACLWRELPCDSGSALPVRRIVFAVHPRCSTAIPSSGTQHKPPPVC